MRNTAGALLMTMISALPVLAKAPEQSLHPLSRPNAEVVVKELVTASRVTPSVRPVSEQAAQMAEKRPDGLAFLSPDLSLRPWLRPPEITQKAMAKRQLRRKGAVCGDIDIEGEVVGNVPGRIKACGIRDAVRVKSVAGVRLNPPALMNCKTAVALKDWTEKGLKPAFRRRGPVVEMKVAAHYACRTRNNIPGARVSEHGKGNAIDLSAFTMMDGEVITVFKGWDRAPPFVPCAGPTQVRAVYSVQLWAPVLMGITRIISISTPQVIEADPIAGSPL